VGAEPPPRPGSAGATDTQGPRERTAVLALLVLALTLTSAAAMRVVFSPVQELAKADLHLSDLEISLVQGLAASIPIAVLAIPLGRMVDRRNRVRILLSLGVVWTAGAALTVVAQGFAALFVARMLAGVGAMCAVPVAISIAADLCPPDLRGRSLLLLSLGNMVGPAAAFALGGWLLGALASGSARALPGLAPWRGVHLAFAVASALLLVPLLLTREPTRHELGEAAGGPLGPALHEMWERRRLLIPLFLGQVTVVMADTAAAIWAAPVLTRDYHLQPADFGGWVGLVVLLSGVVGSAAGGVAADLGHKGKIPGGILIGAAVAAVCSIPGAFFPLMPSVLAFALMLSLFLTCGAITGLVTATAIAVLIPNEIRGVCLGAFIVLGALIGLGVAPTMVTLISGALGGESFVRYGLTATGIATSVVAAIGFISASRAR
jgi:MFS family permease